jgi:formylglycine-generating enzyme required for sulfatase activity
MREEIARQRPEERDSDLVSLTLSILPGDGAHAPSRLPKPHVLILAALAVAGLGLGWLAWSQRGVARGGPPTVTVAPAGMVLVPAGPFAMGSSPEEIAAAYSWCRELASAGCDRAIYEREAPRREVVLSSFAIDATEVTNAQFAKWLAEAPRVSVEGDRLVRRDGGLLADLHPAHGGLRLTHGRIEPVEGAERKPVVQITWAAARGYCADQSKRLPTEAEWERAARGTGGRLFPWGNERPTCATSVFGRGAGGPCTAEGEGSRAVGATIADRTSEGVFDLGGNVSEWVEDSFREGLPEKVCRGGNWGALAEMCRAPGRSRRTATEVSHQIGFRCAASW